ncbi:MAG: fluoride efflux transporter CrcB [Salibacteraceae bacterium]
MNWVAVFIGGGLGSLMRYAISRWVISFGYAHLPLATFLANLFATALLAVVVWKLPIHVSPNWHLALAVGLCGGLSTFSTFSLETYELIKSGQTVWALINVGFSIFACLLIILILSKSLK